MQLFLSVLIISILYGVEVDLFIPSFPEIQQVFKLSPFLVQLTLSANYIAYAVCAVFAGALGDRFNRRTVIMASLAIFVFASILCVSATHYSLLVLGRFLQGVGMAGPAVLSYVVIADAYPLKKQMALLGLLNGMVTIAMAFAPVVGSYVTHYFNWRANFMVLLMLGIIAFIACYTAIPNHKGDSKVSLSPAAYMPLLTSSKLMIFVAGLCLFGISYWTFIGMAPILYMEDFGVPLTHFGYYQGGLAFSFGVISLSSPKIIRMFGLRNCLYYSLGLCFLATVALLIAALSGTSSPVLITAIMMVLGATVAFPIQILFPIALQIIPNSKARVSALINAIRLVCTAGFLELISYFYGGKFFLLGVANSILTFMAIYLIWHVIKKDWVKFGHI